MVNVNMSLTTARWVIGLATTLVRQGLGRDWTPVNPNSGLQPIGPAMVDSIEGPLGDKERNWINALLILAKTIAGILAYQVEPDMDHLLISQAEDSAGLFDYGLPGFEPDES